jgi:Domain of unknown function (DUF1883)
MDFLHHEVVLNDLNEVRVDLIGTEANIKVMDDFNFQQYRSGGRHRYYGGHYRQSPAIIQPPTSGRWHVAIDLGGFAGRLQAKVSII